MLPSASGAAIERAERISAAFHGAIAPTTPTGRRMPIAKVPGMVGREHLADRRVGERRRLAEQARHEVHLEHAEAEARAGLAREQRRRPRRCAALEHVGGLQEDPLPPAGGDSATTRRTPRRGLDRAPRVARGPAGTRATTSPVYGSRSSNVSTARRRRPSRRRCRCTVSCESRSWYVSSFWGHPQHGLDDRPASAAAAASLMRSKS